jgi:hypothetical protein
MCDHASIVFQDRSYYMYKQLSACMRATLSMYTSNSQHVYEQLSACIRATLSMYTSNSQHVYEQISACIRATLSMYTSKSQHAYEQCSTRKRSSVRAQGVGRQTTYMINKRPLLPFSQISNLKGYQGTTQCLEIFDIKMQACRLFLQYLSASAS